MPLRSLLRRLLAPEHRLLACGLLLLADVWLFGALASEVMEGESRAFDEGVLRALRDPLAPARLRGPAWLAEAVRDLTALGSYAVVTLALLAAVGFLLLAHKPAMASMVAAAGGGGIMLNTVMKQLFARSRPTVVPPLVEVGSESFPSGHAMLAAAVYLSIALLIAQVVQRRRAKLYVFAVAATLVVVIGVSRVLLGVHYPTDVVAGWLAGGLWALICGVAARSLQQRGAVERPGDEPAANGD